MPSRRGPWSGSPRTDPGSRQAGNGKATSTDHRGTAGGMKGEAGWGAEAEGTGPGDGVPFWSSRMQLHGAPSTALAWEERNWGGKDEPRTGGRGDGSPKVAGLGFGSLAQPADRTLWPMLGQSWRRPKGARSRPWTGPLGGGRGRCCGHNQAPGRSPSPPFATGRRPGVEDGCGGGRPHVTGI